MTAAAVRLKTGASTLSDSVKILEAQVGETLLERRRSGAVPTGRGLELYEEARTIVSALDRALGPGDARETASLRVSLPGELAQGWFDAALRQIQRERPDIRLVLMVEDALVDHTKYARDLHIRVGLPESRSGMVEIAGGQTRAVMVAAAGLLDGVDPKDLKAVSQLPFVGKPRASRHATIKLRDGTALKFEHLLQVSEIATRISLVRAGLGVTTCLERSVRDDLRRGTLVRLCPEQFDFPVQISIASPHKKPSKAAKAVAELLGATL